jgi:hypothetical protein
MKKQLFGTYSLLAFSVPAALFTIAPDAQAIGVMRGSTATTALTSIAGSNVANITNQSGLSSPYTSGVTDFSSYVANTTNLSPAPSNFFLFNSNSGVITFNLGASYTLNALALWQFAADTPTSVRGFNLYADTDADTSNLGTSLGSFNAINSTNPIGAQVFNFSSTSTQFVQLEITSNGNSTNTGLGEVAFAEAVPWETDALSVIGTTLLFAGGVWKKYKSVKPLDKQ